MGRFAAHEADLRTAEDRTGSGEPVVEQNGSAEASPSLKGSATGERVMVNKIGGEEVLVTRCEDEFGEVLERGLAVAIACSCPVGQWTGSGA